MSVRNSSINTSFAQVRAALTEWIGSADFSCVGAKAALGRGELKCVELGALCTSSATTALHDELTELAATVSRPEALFHTILAVFDGPDDLGEIEFERHLWRQLGMLHRLDVARGHRWVETVSTDPESESFGFSVAGSAFFVVGMHSNASRLSRRFDRPVLAFNSHQQFDRLRKSGVYDGIKRVVRRREVRLQGATNPNQGDFGAVSEARQYSGRAVEAEWQCPFSVASEGAS